MIQRLSAQLTEWQADDGIIAIWLEGAGEKAFCAGGDIVQMHRSMVDTRGEGRNPFIEQYFAEEYTLDYQIHTSNTPVIVFGSGVVMGGGMGLMQGADIRLVTQTTRLAMPEITIGLFPDVGASWFLNRLPKAVGLFLGLTGVHVNGRDAVAVGMADRFVSADAEALLAGLSEQTFSENTQANRDVLFRFFQGAEIDSSELPSPLHTHLAQIQQLCDASNVQTAVAQLLDCKERDSWFDRALSTLEKGCPQTMHLVWEQLQRARYLSLAGVFRMEWCLAVQCALHGDFQEGVRALLIDKDGAPSFRHQGVNEVSAEYIDGFFTSPAPTHPLASLGAD